MYLNCKTYFSLRYGTFSTAGLVAAAVDMNIPLLALTNINNTCDSWDFVKRCREAGIKPIVGAEIRNGDDFLYLLIAANNRGFEWINRFLSEHLTEGKPFPQTAGEHPFFNDLWDGFVIYPLHGKDPNLFFANERIGILPSEINKLFGADMELLREKLVIRQPVTFQDKPHFNVHRLLRAIDKNTLLSKLPKEVQCQSDEYFIPPHELLNRFCQYPFIVTNTYRLMDDCNIRMDFRTDKNKKTFSATKEDDRVLLEKLALDGFSYRYGNKDITAMNRLKSELKVINDLGFNAYFLITWDIIRYAQARGFYHVGRGSGANSIVAYCLKITDVDPIELDLYFERFLNPYRTSPPDFDIDFSWLDRDEVIDYVFKRYGKDHVALLGMYSTFQYRAVVRELGKVFGLPKEEIDKLAHGAAAEDHIHRQILRYGKLIENFPNHLSIHPGGMLISEESIHQYTPVFMPPKGFATAQIDMFIAEDIGLYKLDILSQRGLGHIKESLRLIKANKGVDVDIHAFQKFKKDLRVKEQIRNVNTIGCFYIESPAMRQLLKKLECDDYITLVAASSIIRPGVASSGMMRAYIERYHDPHNINYIHPILKELLEETFGVMVFQEDVIKVAHHFAGLDMGEADILRRAMSGKYRGSQEMLRIKEKFLAGCKERGHPDEVAHEVWRQIQSFGGYSFSKAHSASFAVESYQSLFLKTYYPREFMVAVINNFGGFYNQELYFRELSKSGAIIHPPCINRSNYYTNIDGNEVYVGFVHVKSLEQGIVENFLEERKQHGHFLHLQDFIERTGIPQEQLNTLVSVGAFGFTGKKKKQLLWEANFLQKKNSIHVPASASIFQEPEIEFQLPELSNDVLDDLFDELETLDFPISSPFRLLHEDPYKYMLAKDIASHVGKTITTVAYFVEYKIVPTINKKPMSFGTFLDVELNWIDTVQFPNVFAQYPIKGKGFYKITGKVVSDFGVHVIEVKTMHKLGYKKRAYANL